MRSIKFHQGFKLDRSRLATLMRCMTENKVVAKKAAAAYIGVGEAAAEGTIGWLIKTGLGAASGKGYELTPLGKLVAANDPELSQHNTLWLMHYFLVTEQPERAEVWHRAFNDFLSPQTPCTREALQSYVEQSMEVSPTNQSGIDSDCKEFWKCYTTTIGLGKLDLIREIDKTTYEVGLIGNLDPTLVAFTLFTTWQRRFPHTDTLRISQLCDAPELTGKVFAARRDQVVNLLQKLQSMGLVNIVDSQHEPVTRRYRDEAFQLLSTAYPLS
jgi:hypothetical protein